MSYFIRVPVHDWPVDRCRIRGTGKIMLNIYVLLHPLSNPNNTLHAVYPMLIWSYYDWSHDCIDSMGLSYKQMRKLLLSFIDSWPLVDYSCTKVGNFKLATKSILCVASEYKYWDTRPWKLILMVSWFIIFCIDCFHHLGYNEITLRSKSSFTTQDGSLVYCIQG